MSGILVLILRIIMAASLYTFLGWAIYTMWKELRVRDKLLSPKPIPAIQFEPIEFEADLPGELRQQEIIIGRDPSCEIAIAQETISARHARVSYRQTQWWVEDLHSTNGTFINEEAVNTPMVIISGDELRCGKVKLRILIQPEH